jgi:hypothetical protein
MFRLRVSKTLPSFSIAFLLSGPGICVLMMGPAGSSGKNGCSPGVSGIAAAAAAEAYRLRNALGVIREALCALKLKYAGRARPAVRRSEAMASEVWIKVWGIKPRSGSYKELGCGECGRGADRLSLRRARE